MVQNEQNEVAEMEVKKWTLMFFFASDNNLSPSMLYQLKSIKAAGYQLDTNVLVHFDPHERGFPSVIFDINKTEKQGQQNSRIGDCRDLNIRNLSGDQVEPDVTRGRPKSSADYDNQDANEALTHFLEFCAEKYPAEHYMLFLVGHGLVVGRDAFLPDDNPNSGISLVDLDGILNHFDLVKKTGVLELIGMHSCSMSAVEVAYQLKGKAKYMIASEGLSFVGAWPYRQMLLKIFYAIDGGMNTDAELDLLVKDLHELCVQNSTDFIFAGYSSDLCLCSLDPKRVTALAEPIQQLAKSLRLGLVDDRGKELILLAHLKSQSYFQEAYTDLYDFCLCLGESCSDSDSNRVQLAMKHACGAVMEALTPGIGPIIQADFFGPDCQYSYGLSIYFPWVRPIEDAGEHVISNYEKYAFVTDLPGTSWLEFLKAYFRQTLRTRRAEINPNPDFDRDTALKLVTSSFKAVGFQAGPPDYASTMLTGKVNPSDASGYWTPSYIKNYPRYDPFPISERALRVFAPERGQGETKVDNQAAALPRKIAC